MRERLTVAIFILLTVLATSLQFIVGYLVVPEGMMYLGTVHWPSDYFYYLSQFIQGRESWLTSTVLYTPEKLSPVLIGWQHVLSGKLLSLLGINVIFSYQVAVAVFLILFLAAAYFLIKEIFPDSTPKRLLALWFFISSTSFVKIVGSGQGFLYYYYNHWYNLGSNIQRFSPTPHHLLAYALGSINLLIFIRITDKKSTNWRLNFLLAIGAILQASINPVAFLLLAFVFLFVCLLLKRQLLTPTFFLLAGLPSAFYARWVFSRPPYNLSSAWEAGQQLIMTPLTLFQDSGLIIIFAIIGVWPYLKKINSKKLTLLLFLTVSLVFYLTKIPSLFSLSNARFWSSHVYIVWAILAAEGIYFISNIFKKGQKWLFLLLLAVYLITIIPSYYIQYQELLKPKSGNSFYYIPRQSYDIFLKARQISSRDDIFLVAWPYNESFPALTGRKTFFGFDLLTIDHKKKLAAAYQIIDGKVTVSRAQEILAANRIKYVMVFPSRDNIARLSKARLIEGNNSLNFYQISYTNPSVGKAGDALRELDF